MLIIKTWSDKLKDSVLWTRSKESIGMLSLWACILIGLIINFFIGIDEQLLIVYLGVVLISAVDLLGVKNLTDRIVKLLLESSVVFLLITQGVEIKDWHHLFGERSLPLWITHMLNIVFVVSLINIYESLDKQGGLAGSFSLITVAFTGVLCIRVGLYGLAILGMSIGVVVTIMMIVNICHPKKVCFANQGILVLGTTIAISIIKLWEYGKGYQASITDIDYWKILVTLPCIPVFEILRVSVTRLWRSRAQIAWKENYLHHNFIKLGCRPFQISIIMWIFQCIMITVVIIVHPENLLIELLILSSIYVIFCLSVNYVIIYKENKQKCAINKYKSLSE